MELIDRACLRGGQAVYSEEGNHAWAGVLSSLNVAKEGFCCQDGLDLHLIFYHG